MVEREIELPGEKKTDGLKGVVIWNAIKKKDMQRNASHLFECVCALSCVDQCTDTQHQQGGWLIHQANS